MKTTADAAMFQHRKKTKPGNKYKKFKKENGKKSNNNATMRKSTIKLHKCIETGS